MSASSAKKDALLHKYKKVNSLPLLRMRTRPSKCEDFFVKIPISNARALGKVVRGSETVQWGKLFQVLEGLGIQVEVDVPAVLRLARICP
jgi:hypothetical protein